MFEVMMQSGGYRVDYLNLNSAYQSNAIGFYVCGRLDCNHRYSLQARHHLLAGYHWITHTRNLENLVAVYLDVCNEEIEIRPAYQMLIEDILSGMFRRVVISQQEPIQVNEFFTSKISELSQLEIAIELIPIVDNQYIHEWACPTFVAVN